MQPRAGFMLDGVGIVLQVLDVVFHAGVFVLQFLDLFLKLFVFDALLVKRGNPVSADDNVVSEKNCEGYGRSRGNTSAHPIGKTGNTNEVGVLYVLFHYAIWLSPLYCDARM